MRKSNKLLVFALVIIIGVIAGIEMTKVKPIGLEEYGVVNMEGKAPELVGIKGYINVDESFNIMDLIGEKVVLIDFWTYSCINCIRTLPYITAWDERYKDKGLVIIGVHTPEFNFEKKIENVKKAVEKYNIKYAVVQDNDYGTWRAYNNNYWPAKYLINKDGEIIYSHFGEGRYEETEKKIQLALEELNQQKIEQELIKNPDQGRLRVQTPELYFGAKFDRGGFGNEEGLQFGKTIDFKLPEKIQGNKGYFDGEWRVDGDYSELVEDEGRVILLYNAANVNIVAESLEGSSIEVYVDGEKVNEVEVKDAKLYSLIDDEYKRALVELKVKGKGFRIFTFTFG